LDKLTPDYILTKVDAKLGPNAWMIRGISAWRLGEHEAARVSSEKGLEEPSLNPGSREDIILRIIPALAIDKEAHEIWQRNGSKLSGAQYADQRFHLQFTTAMRQFAEAEGRFANPTPQSVRNYVHYQHWRVLQNWRQVIVSIQDQGAKTEAYQQAQNVVGISLKEAAEAQRDAIAPQDDSYRQLIRAQGGG
jgi:hypothetical protein